MKHIKNFESIHNQKIKNQYYEFMPTNLVSNDLIPDEWTYEEINKISDKFNLPEEIEIRRFNRGIRVKSLMMDRDSIDRDMLVINIRKYSINICKYKDEWYKLVPTPNYGTMTHIETRHYVYICDQLEGVLKLLEEFIKKNK